jgi:transcriptional regulator with XRE-family HTH domain
MGYTQTELGDILGVTNKAISRWEKGDSFPDVGILENLATCLNIRIEDIVSGETTHNNKENIIAELTRIVKIQTKENIRTKRDNLVCVALALILIGRFCLSFFSDISNVRLTKYDLFIIVICYLIIIRANCNNWKYVIKDDVEHSKAIFALTIITFALSVIFIYGGYLFLQNLLMRFINVGNIGPSFSYLLGGIVLTNILLFEYTWLKLRKKGIRAQIALTFNITTIFICCSFRDWMGTLLADGYLFKISSIIICSIIFAIISNFFEKKHAVSCQL